MKAEGDTASPPVLHVMAGALFDPAGRVLVAQRPAGKHMAGKWEFPGGKRAPSESPFDALRRELDEELGIAVETARPLIQYEDAYPDRIVVLDLWCVTEWSGEPQSREGQGIDWLVVDDLANIDLLEADRPMIDVLRQYVRGA